MHLHLLLGNAKTSLRSIRAGWSRTLDEVPAKADEGDLSPAPSEPAWSHCSPPGIRRVIPSHVPTVNCAAIRSAPGLQLCRVQAATSGSLCGQPLRIETRRPYLDASNYKIVHRSTAILAFIAESSTDLALSSDSPALKDIEPSPHIDLRAARTQNGNHNLSVKPRQAAFDNADLPRAMAPPWTANPSSTFCAQGHGQDCRRDAGRRRRGRCGLRPSCGARDPRLRPRRAKDAGRRRKISAQVV